MSTLRKDRGHIGVDFLAVNHHRCDTLANVLRVLHFDFVGSTAELTGHLEAVPLGGMQGFTIRPLKLARTPMMNCVAAW